MMVETVVETCGACPSQWEASLRDGRMLYIRYRWGNLSIRVSRTPTEDVYAAVRGQEIYNITLGDSLDGVLSYEDLVACTKEKISWPDAVPTLSSEQRLRIPPDHDQNRGSGDRQP